VGFPTPLPVGITRSIPRGRVDFLPKTRIIPAEGGNEVDEPKLVDRFFVLQERATDLGFDLTVSRGATPGAGLPTFSITRDEWKTPQTWGSLDHVDGFLEGWELGRAAGAAEDA